MKLVHLTDINAPTPLAALGQEQVKELQEALKQLGYPIRVVDGLVGENTTSAWAEFRADVYQENSDRISQGSLISLKDKLHKIEDTEAEQVTMKLVHLTEIKGPTPLAALGQEQVEELQKALMQLGYPVRVIDGLMGKNTASAWAEFKTDVYQGNPDLIGQGSLDLLQEKLDQIVNRKDYDFSTKEGTIQAIKDECEALDIGLKTQIAYVLATVEWETAQTFEPVREAFWLSEEWRRNNLRYYPYYGRGYVQITWKYNYEKYGKILGIDLVNNPDLAMDGNVALFVLVHGFKTGGFTGRKITDYINKSQTDFVSARRCINGTDKAHKIAQIADKYLHNL